MGNSYLQSFFDSRVASVLKVCLSLTVAQPPYVSL